MKNLISLAATVERYAREIAPANVMSGWEKYILTDGEVCVLVGKDHTPAPGEAVFDVRIRNRQVTVELHRHESMQAKRPLNLTISEEARRLLKLHSKLEGISISGLIEKLIRDYSKNATAMITLTVKTSQGKLLGSPVTSEDICDIFSAFTSEGYDWWVIKDGIGILDASYTSLNIGPDDSCERLLRALQQRQYHPQGDLI